MKTSVIYEFLRESNAIEGVYDNQSLYDASVAYQYIFLADEIILGRILVAHSLLMKRHLPAAVCGQWRTCAVRVGGRKCMPAKDVPAAMEEWLVKAREATTYEAIRQSHIDFEIIHPFMDGNGRIGRIIFLWQQVTHNTPFHIFLEATKDEYYKWFETEEQKKEKILEHIKLYESLKG